MEKLEGLAEEDGVSDEESTTDSKGTNNEEELTLHGDNDVVKGIRDAGNLFSLQEGSPMVFGKEEDKNKLLESPDEGESSEPRVLRVPTLNLALVPEKSEWNQYEEMISSRRESARGSARTTPPQAVSSRSSREEEKPQEGSAWDSYHSQVSARTHRSIELAPEPTAPEVPLSPNAVTDMGPPSPDQTVMARKLAEYNSNMDVMLPPVPRAVKRTPKPIPAKRPAIPSLLSPDMAKSIINKETRPGATESLAPASPRTKAKRLALPSVATYTEVTVPSPQLRLQDMTPPVSASGVPNTPDAQMTAQLTTRLAEPRGLGRIRLPSLGPNTPSVSTLPPPVPGSPALPNAPYFGAA